MPITNIFHVHNCHISIYLTRGTALNHFIASLPIKLFHWTNDLWCCVVHNLVSTVAAVAGVKTHVIIILLICAEAEAQISDAKRDHLSCFPIMNWSVHVVYGRPHHHAWYHYATDLLGRGYIYTESSTLIFIRYSDKALCTTCGICSPR